MAAVETTINLPTRDEVAGVLRAVAAAQEQVDTTSLKFSHARREPWAAPQLSEAAIGHMFVSMDDVLSYVRHMKECAPLILDVLPMLDTPPEKR